MVALLRFQATGPSVVVIPIILSNSGDTADGVLSRWSPV